MMKKIDKIKIVDLIFTVIFIGCLFIPVIHINKDSLSKIENRPLAELTPLISSNYTINYNFGKDFDNWFKDRFFLRNKFISIYLGLKYNLPVFTYQFSHYVLNKKTNYIFDYLYFSNRREEYLNNSVIIDSDVIANLKRIEAFCKENNIKLYILLPPLSKEIGSKNSFPLLIREKTYLENKKRVVFIFKETGINIIYPYDQVLDYSEHSVEPVYFKADYHWTDIGAYVAYKVLMDEIKKDFPNIKISQMSDFNTFTSFLTRACPVYGFFDGAYYEGMFLQDKNILDQEYTYLVPKNYKNITEMHDANYKIQTIKNYYYNKNNPKAPNILMYGDSFSLNMLPGLISSSNTLESVFTFGIRDDNLGKFLESESFKQDLIEKNIDILVLCFMQIDLYQYLYTKGAKNGI